MKNGEEVQSSGRELRPSTALWKKDTKKQKEKATKKVGKPKEKSKWTKEEMEKVPSEYEMLVLNKRIQNERRMIDKGLDLNGHVALELAKLEEQKAMWEANIEKEKKKNGEEKAAEHLNAEQNLLRNENEDVLDSFDISNFEDVNTETAFDDDTPENSTFDDESSKVGVSDDEPSKVNAGDTVKDQGTTAFFIL